MREERLRGTWEKRGTAPAFTRRGFLAGGGSLVGALAVAACASGSGGNSSSGGQGKPAVINVVGQPDPVTAPQIIADKRGFWAKYNVSPNITNFASGTDGLNSLLSGQMDFLVSSALQPLISRTEGGAVFCLGQEAQSGKHLGIVTHTNVTSASGLVGKKIGYEYGSAAQVYLPKYLQHFGIPLSSVTTVNVDPPDTAAAMTRGDIDAAVIWEPWRDKLEAAVSGLKTLTLSGDIGYYVNIDIWVGKRLNADPNLASRMLSGLYEAALWLSDKSNLTEAASLVAPVIGVTETLAKEYIGEIWTYKVSWSDAIKTDMVTQQQFAASVLKNKAVAGVSDWTSFYAGFLNSKPLQLAEPHLFS
jgi:ABC-type nitrate/sulfonate/bicarbonate transport system substrate-binding protein